MGLFSHPFAEIGRRYENKQEKARDCLAFPSQDTADGNADRIRLCGAFEDSNKNCDLGVAVFERKIRQKKGDDLSADTEKQTQICTVALSRNA